MSSLPGLIIKSTQDRLIGEKKKTNVIHRYGGLTEMEPKKWQGR